MPVVDVVTYTLPHLQQVLPHTQGKRLLVIAAHRDAEKSQALKDLLELSHVDWPEYQNRPAYADLVAHVRKCDYVLLTRWQGHSQWDHVKQLVRQYQKPVVWSFEGLGETRVVEAFAETLGLKGKDTPMNGTTLNGTVSLAEELDLSQVLSPEEKLEQELLALTGNGTPRIRALVKSFAQLRLDPRQGRPERTLLRQVSEAAGQILGEPVSISYAYTVANNVLAASQNGAAEPVADTPFEPRPDVISEALELEIAAQELGSVTKAAAKLEIHPQDAHWKLQIAKMPENIQAMLARGEVPLSHVRLIARLNGNEPVQQELARRCAARYYTSTTLAATVQAVLNGASMIPPVATPAQTPAAPSPLLEKEVEELHELLATAERERDESNLELAQLEARFDTVSRTAGTQKEQLDKMAARVTELETELSQRPTPQRALGLELIEKIMCLAHHGNAGGDSKNWTTLPLEDRILVLDRARRVLESIHGA